MSGQKESTARQRNSYCTAVLERKAIEHGYQITHKDKSGRDEFVAALDSGEAIVLLLGDDDYTLALQELPVMIENAQSEQVAELLRDLLSSLPTDID